MTRCPCNVRQCSNAEPSPPAASVGSPDPAPRGDENTKADSRVTPLNLSLTEPFGDEPGRRFAYRRCTFRRASTFDFPDEISRASNVSLIT
jgi:hypothetical protein